MDFYKNTCENCIYFVLNKNSKKNGFCTHINEYKLYIAKKIDTPSCHLFIDNKK